MSLIGSSTKADYIPWEQMLLLVQKLERDKQLIWSQLIATGCYTGLRIGDLLSLTWEMVLDKTELELVEEKTKKLRKIKLNNNLVELTSRLFQKRGIKDTSKRIFLSSKLLKPFSVQYINRKLKKLKYRYGLRLRNFSTHSFRKTFGRHIWEQSNFSEKAITILSDIFNHSSTKITRRYLGINQQDMDDVYEWL